MNLKGIALFLSPLFYFVLMFLGILFSTLFYPAIATAISGTRAQIAANGISESNFWGLSWSLSSARLIMFMSSLFVGLIGIGIMWVKRKFNLKV